MDNLVTSGAIPKVVAIFLDAGDQESREQSYGSQRGLEYNTLSPTFAEFVEASVRQPSSQMKICSDAQRTAFGTLGHSDEDLRTGKS